MVNVRVLMAEGIHDIVGAAMPILGEMLDTIRSILSVQAKTT
jgi:hypothetical protein